MIMIPIRREKRRWREGGRERQGIEGRDNIRVKITEARAVDHPVTEYISQ